MLTGGLGFICDRLKGVLEGFRDYRNVACVQNITFWRFCLNFIFFVIFEAKWRLLKILWSHEMFICSKSFPGGNQVGGLPPAQHFDDIDVSNLRILETLTFSMATSIFPKPHAYKQVFQLARLTNIRTHFPNDWRWAEKLMIEKW